MIVYLAIPVTKAYINQGARGIGLPAFAVTPQKYFLQIIYVATGNV